MIDLSVDTCTALEREALAALAQNKDATALEAWRVTYLGRKGKVSQLLRQVSKLPLADKKQVGQAANVVKRHLTDALNERQVSYGRHTSRIDRNALSAPVQAGHLHPLTLAIRRIQDIFAEMGFTIVEGPYVEEAKYNFDLLNIPLDHPARSESDTFQLAGGHVLRTHTSPVQMRAVLEYDMRPPFRILSPGRVFRAERTDATHESTFYQFEGLVVDDTVSVATFKGTIETFYAAFFDAPVVSRLRPSYFPFVEPGFEVDISCIFCEQRGCRICKQSGWIEVMGAGLVHPNVLKNMNLDPAKVRGFAFGGAVDRLAMLQHGIEDIRLFWSGELSFLRQFS